VSAPDRTPPAWLPRLFLVAALVLFGALVWRSSFLIDDAFISFRYAKNWAAGLGPVYNPGVEPPVEGYSNFLWVALLAVGKALGASPVGLAPALSILCALATLGLAARCMHRELELDPWSTGLATLALAALPPFVVWATGGLETALFGLELFGAWLLLVQARGEGELRRGLLAGLLGLALVLTRVEGLIWIGGLVLASVVACRDAIPLKRLGAYALVVAAGTGAHLLWRHATYGEWVANTVHAKAGFSGATLARGGRSLATFALLFLWPLFVLPAPWLARESRQRRLALSALVVVLGTVGYNLLVGGDWMPMFRFMAPASAFLALLLGVGLERLRTVPRLVTSGALTAFALLPLFDVSPVPRALREALYYRDFVTGYQSEWARLKTTHVNLERNSWRGQAMGAIFDQGQTWVGGAIGATGYYSDVFVHDRNGLVNREIARLEAHPGGGTAGHEKRVPRIWFRKERPTFYKVFTAVKEVAPTGPSFDAVMNILIQVLFTDPADHALTSCSVVRFYPVGDRAPHRRYGSLIAVEHTDDPEEAFAFWSRYLDLRRAGGSAPGGQ